MPSTSVKIKTYKDKLEELRLKRNEARNLNYEEVVEESRKSKLEKNFEAKKQRAERQLQKLEEKKMAETKGESYEQNLRLQHTALDIEEFSRKAKKKNPDPGFSDYAAASYRQYTKLIRGLKPDLEKYQSLKAAKKHVIDTTGPGLLDLYSYSTPSAEAVEKVVKDVQKKREQREKFSRRRTYYAEADVDFINERNRRYNLRTQRFYGKYTDDIKKSLERGTAL